MGTSFRASVLDFAGRMKAAASSSRLVLGVSLTVTTIAVVGRLEREDTSKAYVPIIVATGLWSAISDATQSSELQFSLSDGTPPQVRIEDPSRNSLGKVILPNFVLLSHVIQCVLQAPLPHASPQAAPSPVTLDPTDVLERPPVSSSNSTLSPSLVFGAIRRRHESRRPSHFTSRLILSFVA